MRTSRLAWALTLGLALALTAGAVSTVAPSRSAPAVTQDGTTGVLADAPATNFLDPYPGDMTTVPLEGGDADTVRGEDVATIALVARWGYLNNPAVAALEGRWTFNDTRTGGSFSGGWHLVNGRAHGSLEGRFTLPDDGHGRFRGTWSVADSRVGGFLWGEWVRGNRTNGHFDGHWNFTSGRDGGALAGGWATFRDHGGGFRGRAIAAPTMAPVDWDGALAVTDGGVHLARTIRFERDDRVLPQTNRSRLEWTSTTTVNWDGFLTVLRIADPNATVTLRTTQVSFRWTARELPGLHVVQAVDRAGHAIEVRGFLIHPPEPRPCDCAALKIGLRWGNLSANETGGGTGTDWDGFAQITYGAVGVRQVLAFERIDGDHLLPRGNVVTVSWASDTGRSDWDGLALGAVVPLRAWDVTYFTVHAGAFTHVFRLSELLGDHTFDLRDGNQVEVRAVRL